MNRIIKIGAVYRHYKNPLSRYRVLQMGFDEETTKPVVIYQTEHSCPRTVWVRELKSWHEPAVLATGESVDRFIEVEN